MTIDRLPTFNTTITIFSAVKQKDSNNRTITTYTKKVVNRCYLSTKKTDTINNGINHKDTYICRIPYDKVTVNKGDIIVKGAVKESFTSDINILSDCDNCFTIKTLISGPLHIHVEGD